jgi:hypothetical protein
MENQPAEVLQRFRNIIDENTSQAMYEIELCDTVEKCIEWKRKYLGKDSLIQQILKGLYDRPTTD